MEQNAKRKKLSRHMTRPQNSTNIPGKSVAAKTKILNHSTDLHTTWHTNTPTILYTFNVMLLVCT